jgi:hypothetical protein
MWMARSTVPKMDSQRVAMWATLSESKALSWVEYWVRLKVDCSECVRVVRWDAKKAVRMAGYWADLMAVRMAGCLDVAMAVHWADLRAERWADWASRWALGWAN